MLISLLTVPCFASENISNELQEILEKTQCNVMEETYTRISIENNIPAVVSTTKGLPTCVLDALVILPLPNLNNEQIIFTFQPDTNTVQASILPITYLHYFYHNTDITIEQRMKIALYLGVIHEYSTNSK